MKSSMPGCYPGQIVTMQPSTHGQKHRVGSPIVYVTPPRIQALVLLVIPPESGVHGETLVCKHPNEGGSSWREGYAQWVQDACEAANIPEDQSILLVTKDQLRSGR